MSIISDAKHWFDKVKNAGKEILEKTKKEGERAIKKVEDEGEQAVHQVKVQEARAVKGINAARLKAVREVKGAAESFEDEIENLGESLEEEIEAAFQKLLDYGIAKALNQVADLAQTAIPGKKAKIKIGPLGYVIDLNSKIDELQAIAKNPPSSKKQLLMALAAFVEKDDLLICPNIPYVFSGEIPVPVEKIEGLIEKLV